LLVFTAGWLVAITVGTLLTRTTNSRKGPDNKLKKQRFCLLPRTSKFNALGGVLARDRRAPAVGEVPYPWNPIRSSNS
jgi:hypothetical protein